MGVENLNRFHWILIGAFVGVVLAWSWASTSHNVEGYATSDLISFERDLVQKDAQSGKPLITNIVIHPPEYSPADSGNVNLVTYKRLARDKQGRYGWIDKRVVAKIPYVPAYRGRVQVQNAADLTVEKYLGDLAKSNDFIKFNNGWWLIPKNAMMLGGAAGVVLIGGIWPTLLGLLTGAGLGPAPKPKSAKKEKPLWQYKSTATATVAKPAVSARDQAELEAVTSAYERTLGEAATEGGSAEAPATATAETEVRKLEGGTLEQQEAMKQPGDDDDIEVKGIYYPVLIHHKKGTGKDTKENPSEAAPSTGKETEPGESEQSK